MLAIILFTVIFVALSFFFCTPAEEYIMVEDKQQFLDAAYTGLVRRMVYDSVPLGTFHIN